jgi:hypothetical protein
MGASAERLHGHRPGAWRWPKGDGSVGSRLQPTGVTLSPSCIGWERADHAIHRIQVSQWKKLRLEGASELFT